MEVTLTGGYYLNQLNKDTFLMRMCVFPDSYLIRVIQDEESKHILIFNGEEGKRQDLLGVIQDHLPKDSVQSTLYSVEDFIQNQRCALAVSFVLDGLLNGNDFKEIRS